jgi:hypothetical protein
MISMRHSKMSWYFSVKSIIFRKGFPEILKYFQQEVLSYGCCHSFKRAE